MKFIVVKRRTIIQIVVAAVLLIGVSIAVGLTGAAAVFSNQSNRRMPITSVRTQERVVALTFDASWGATRTAEILSVLESQGVAATFFVSAEWAERNQSEFQALVNSEKIEIGSLSNTHQNMASMRAAQIKEEIEVSVEALSRATEKEIKLFRAPFGEFSSALLTEIQRSELFAIGFDVDGKETDDTAGYNIARTVVASAREGSIIRLQNDGRHTAVALGGIIAGLKNRGYTFRTVGELIYTENFSLDSNGRQSLRG